MYNRLEGGASRAAQDCNLLLLYPNGSDVGVIQIRRLLDEVPSR